MYRDGLSGRGLRRRGIAAAALCAAMVCPPSSGAQPAAGPQPTSKPRDPAAAVALFRAALEAKRKGDHATACAKFDAAMELDPGVSTLLNIAECHEREGRLATAWVDVQRAQVLNRGTQGEKRQAELASYAQRLIERLEPRLPKLRVVVRAAGSTSAAAPPEGVAVTRDGAAFPLAALGEAVPADPGSTEITVTAPGYRKEVRAVKLEEGKTVEVTIELVSDAPPASSASPSATASATASVTASVPVPPPTASASTAPTGGRRVPTWAFVAGGAGMLFAGASIGFLVSQSSTQNDIDAHCPPPEMKCAAGYDHASANDRLYRDNGLFIGLGVAAVGGFTALLIGFLTAPVDAPRKQGVALGAAAWGSRDAGGLTLKGRF